MRSKNNKRRKRKIFLFLIYSTYNILDIIPQQGSYRLNSVPKLYLRIFTVILQIQKNDFNFRELAMHIFMYAISFWVLQKSRPKSPPPQKVRDKTRTTFEQECIPVECVPSAAVAVCWGRGCLPDTPPPPWTEWQVPVKTLPCRNYVVGGKNNIEYLGE